MPRCRLGWLGPAIAGVGVAVAAVGGWYLVHARPSAGAVIDMIAIDDRRSVVVRAEAGGDRSFVELHDGDQLDWQALVPRYAGHPEVPARAGQPARPAHHGIAWSPTAVSVRVIRDGHAEIFALAMRDAAKLGGLRLAQHHGAIVDDADSPVTLTDHQRSYEIVSGLDWHQLTAVDLSTGRALWSRELGKPPVRRAGVANGVVWIDQGAGLAYFSARSGADANAGGAQAAGSTGAP